MSSFRVWIRGVGGVGAQTSANFQPALPNLCRRNQAVGGYEWEALDSGFAGTSNYKFPQKPFL